MSTPLAWSPSPPKNPFLGTPFSMVQPSKPATVKDGRSVLGARDFPAGAAAKECLQTTF